MNNMPLGSEAAATAPKDISLRAVNVRGSPRRACRSIRRRSLPTSSTQDSTVAENDTRSSEIDLRHGGIDHLTDLHGPAHGRSRKRTRDVRNSNSTSRGEGEEERRYMEVSDSVVEPSSGVDDVLLFHRSRSFDEDSDEGMEEEGEQHDRQHSANAADSDPDDVVVMHTTRSETVGSRRNLFSSNDDPNDLERRSEATARRLQEEEDVTLARLLEAEEIRSRIGSVQNRVDRVLENWNSSSSSRFMPRPDRPIPPARTPGEHDYLRRFTRDSHLNREESESDRKRRRLALARLEQEEELQEDVSRIPVERSQNVTARPRFVPRNLRSTANIPHGSSTTSSSSSSWRPLRSGDSVTVEENDNLHSSQPRSHVDSVQRPVGNGRVSSVGASRPAVRISVQGPVNDNGNGFREREGRRVSTLPRRTASRRLPSLSILGSSSSHHTAPDDSTDTLSSLHNRSGGRSSEARVGELDDHSDGRGWDEVFADEAVDSGNSMMSDAVNSNPLRTDEDLSVSSVSQIPILLDNESTLDSAPLEEDIWGDASDFASYDEHADLEAESMVDTDDSTDSRGSEPTYGSHRFTDGSYSFSPLPYPFGATASTRRSVFNPRYGSGRNGSNDSYANAVSSPTAGSSSVWSRLSDSISVAERISRSAEILNAIRSRRSAILSSVESGPRSTTTRPNASSLFSATSNHIDLSEQPGSIPAEATASSVADSTVTASSSSSSNSRDHRFSRAHSANRHPTTSRSMAGSPPTLGSNRPPPPSDAIDLESPDSEPNSDTMFAWERIHRRYDNGTESDRHVHERRERNWDRNRDRDLDGFRERLFNHRYRTAPHDPDQHRPGASRHRFYRDMEEGESTRDRIRWGRLADDDDAPLGSFGRSSRIDFPLGGPTMIWHPLAMGGIDMGLGRMFRSGSNHADPALLRLAFVDRDFTEADYEMLLQLDERNGNGFSQWKGADVETINQLKSWEVTELDEKRFRGELKEEDEDIIELGRTRTDSRDYGVIRCCICLEDMSRGQKVRQLPCEHTFHALCIDKWLKLQHICPVDKLPVTSAKS